MKFEHLLQIYWTKGFFYNNKLIKFNLNLYNLFQKLSNFNFKNLFFFLKRFELIYFFMNKSLSFLILNLSLRKIINMYFSQYININFSINDLIKYSLVRLYLIKSFKGKCAFLGKPSNGQRTWSNANTSKKINNFLKPFILKIINTFKKKENFNNIKNNKIIKLKKKKIVMKLKLKKKKLNNWF